MGNIQFMLKGLYVFIRNIDFCMFAIIIFGKDI